MSTMTFDGAMMGAWNANAMHSGEMWKVDENGNSYEDRTFPPGIRQEFGLPGNNGSDTISFVPGQWCSITDADIIDELYEACSWEYDWEKDNTLSLQLAIETGDDVNDIHVRPLSDADVETSLCQFEEDFDYEQSLILEKIKNDEINFHKLMACPPEHRVGFCGKSTDMVVCPDMSGNGRGSSVRYNVEAPLFIQERYRFSVKIINTYPSDKQGYALGWTTYGKVYFPEKYRSWKCFSEKGSWVDVTCALQDVEPKGGRKANSFRFTTIFIH